MLEETEDFAVAQTGDIMVSAYQEIVDAELSNKLRLCAYCLRIENNSAERIRLLKKDFCITDSTGKNYFESGYGFHGELPDLEAGECYEFEDTIVISGAAAVLYGTCVAQTAMGDEFKIKLPLMQLASLTSDSGEAAAISENLN